MPSHESYIELCIAGARIFSKCSRRSYFSIILSPSGRTLGTGYNGAPAGIRNCTDGGCPRANAAVAHGSSYENCTAVHAEANALLHSDRSAREGGTLYINGPPCWDCAKLIAGSGIKTVVHTNDLAYKDWPKCLDLLQSAGIRVLSLDTSDHNEHTDSHSEVCGRDRPNEEVAVACSFADGSPVALRSNPLRDVGPFTSLGSDDTSHES